MTWFGVLCLVCLVAVGVSVLLLLYTFEQSEKDLRKWIDDA